MSYCSSVYQEWNSQIPINPIWGKLAELGSLLYCNAYLATFMYIKDERTYTKHYVEIL